MSTSRVTCQPRTTNHATRRPPQASELHPVARRPLQEYVKANGLKVAILFEGRDAAGKGGVISRITSAMSPRVCRVCALGVPTAEERSQWYFQVGAPVG
jgi:polyphosphate kinase 2 (PPK2 family)